MATAPYDPGTPPLVRLVNQHEELFAVDSFRGEGTYMVSLKHRTCDCPHYKGRLSHLPQNDPGRACKHQQAAAAQRPFLLAAVKAKRLSDQQLTDALARHGTNPVVGGALRVERQRRRAAAAQDQALLAVFK